MHVKGTRWPWGSFMSGGRAQAQVVPPVFPNNYDLKLTISGYTASMGPVSQHLPVGFDSATVNWWVGGTDPGATVGGVDFRSRISYTYPGPGTYQYYIEYFGEAGSLGIVNGLVSIGAVPPTPEPPPDPEPEGASVFRTFDMSGFQSDVDKAPIMLGLRFYVVEAGHSSIGLRFWPYPYPSGQPDLSGVYGYLYHGAPVDNLLQVKAFSVVPTPGQWNDLRFDADVPMTPSQYYTVAIYLPHGGYAFLNDAFDSTQPIQSAELAALYVASGNEIDNGVFLEGSIANPAAPPADPAWANFNRRNYGALDVKVI